MKNPTPEKEYLCKVSALFGTQARRKGETFWRILHFIPGFTKVNNGGYADTGDYQKEDDQFYWPEGWYTEVNPDVPTFEHLDKVLEFQELPTI